MDDGDLDCSMGSYFDDILMDTAEQLACTHTHTCNPPAHHLPHTHTCLHVHSTKMAAAGAESSDAAAESPAEFEEYGHATSRSKKGNRAAVRKYREKKKAHTALLEEEAARLRAINKQLAKRVQDHAALEAEAARLRCLLVDVRGRIEGEIGAFPYQRRPAKGGGAQVMSSCDFIGTCEQPHTCFL